MADIKRTNEQIIIDYMARDYDSLLQSMREQIPYKLPEWKDWESEADFGNVLLQLFAHMGDILSYYQDRIANESFLGTAQSRSSIIYHLRMIGYRLATAAPASGMLDLTVPAAFNGLVTIHQGDAFATNSQRDSPSVRFEYTRTVPLPIDFSTISTTAGKKVYVGIPVEEGRLVRNEVIGISSGLPNQHFRLAHSSLILRSLGQGQAINQDIVVTTDAGGIIDSWIFQETLAFSREEQKDFVIEINDEERATLIFGDGVFGAIPRRGAVITATYRRGGGSHGNVSANAIETIVDAPQLSLIPAKVTNPEASTGGADRESLEHAVLHAPSVFRSLKRAVTEDDYKALALEFKGVGKVRAEPAGWNTVKLFIAPQGGGHVSDVLTGNLLAYFEDKRPISTLIEIEDVDYVRIYITAEIGVKSYYVPENVRAQVQKAARDLLAFDKVDFAQKLYVSKFYEAIEAIEGIDYVNISEFRRESPSSDDGEGSGKIQLKKNEIPTAPDNFPADQAYAAGIRVILPEESSR